MPSILIHFFQSVHLTQCISLRLMVFESVMHLTACHMCTAVQLLAWPNDSTAVLNQTAFAHPTLQITAASDDVQSYWCCLPQTYFIAHDVLGSQLRTRPHISATDCHWSSLYLMLQHQIPVPLVRHICMVMKQHCMAAYTCSDQCEECNFLASLIEI